MKMVPRLITDEIPQSKVYGVEHIWQNLIEQLKESLRDILKPENVYVTHL